MSEEDAGQAAAPAGDLEAALGAAWAQLRAGDVDGARLAGLRILGRDPEHGGAKRLLGGIAAHNGDLESARLLLAEAAAAAGGGEEAARAVHELGCLAFAQQDYEAAAARFLEVLEARPDHADAVANLASVRLVQGRHEEARTLFERALALSPGNVQVLSALGRLAAQAGDYARSLRLLAQASALAPADGQIEQAVAQVAGLHRLAWHFPMMNDARRNRAFRSAIERRVRPGDLVLEIGTGSGLLAMMAARAGAERVISLELVPQLAELARGVIARNGYADRVEVLPISSRVAQVGEHLPRPADLLIAEVLDANLLGEDLLGTLVDARERLLAPGAGVLPERVRLMGRLVESEVLERYVSVGEVEGFDLSAFERLALAPLMRFDSVRLGNRALSAPFEVIDLDLTGPLALSGSRRIEVAAEAAGRLDALVLWIDIEVDGEAGYSGDPEGAWSSWHQAVQPVAGRPALEPGRRIAVGLEWHRRFAFFDIGLL